MWKVPDTGGDLAGQRRPQLPCRWPEWAVGGLRELLLLPFDLARHQHAAGVRAGMLPRSLLASARFEQQLGLLERLSLGPLARRP